MSKQRRFEARLFSFSLYREGLCRLRRVGLIATVLLTLFSLLEPLYGWLLRDTPHFFSTRAAYNPILSYRPALDFLAFDGCDGLLPLNPAPFLAAVLLAPLLVMLIFRFLNRRSSSDAHHALPFRRRVMYISLLAAALTWVLIALVSSTVFWLLLMRGEGWFSLSSVLTQWIAALMIALLTAGGAALAMSVTGTAVANVTALLGLLFLPRLLSGAFLSLVQKQLPLIEGGAVFGVLDGQYNLLTDLLFGRLGFRMDSTVSFGAVGPCVYTAALSVLYMALGGVAFCRRRSETAETPASNRILRVLCRLTLPTLLCVPPLWWIADGADEWGLIAACYVLAVAVYFLFELVSTRQVRAMWRAAPALLVLVALNAAFLGGLALCRHQVLRFCPTAQEITAVRVLDAHPVLADAKTVCDNDGREYPNYFYKILEETPLSDSALSQAIAEKLAITVNAFADPEGKEPPSFSLVSRWQMGTRVPLVITCGGREVYRSLYLSDTAISTIAAAMQENEAFRRRNTALPTEGVTVQRFGRVTDPAQCQALYRTLCEEMTEQGFDVFYPSNPDTALYDEAVEIMATVREGGRTYGMRLYLSPQMEATCEQYLKLVRTGDQQQVVADLENALENGGIVRAQIFTDWEKSRTIEMDDSVGGAWSPIRLAALRDRLVMGRLDIRQPVVVLTVTLREYPSRPITAMFNVNDVDGLYKEESV